MRTTNQSCRPLVRSRTVFNGSNLFSAFYPAHSADTSRPAATGAADRYVVYSYGHHWPLFIFVPKESLPDGTPCTATHAGGAADGIWFENQDKYSRSTTKQRSQAHPHCTTIPLSCAAMKDLAESGRVAHAVVMHAEQ
jgi:hypothetical protein